LAILVAGLAVMLLVSVALLGRALRPLATLTETMHRIDPLSPGRRVAIDAADGDVAALSDAFNRMLERLENERRDSARSALSVQEAERRRVADELHDDVGQTLTAMLLQIERVTAGLPEEQRGELDELRETARAGAHDVRRIAQRLAQPRRRAGRLSRRARSTRQRSPPCPRAARGGQARRGARSRRAARPR